MQRPNLEGRPSTARYMSAKSTTAAINAFLTSLIVKATLAQKYHVKTSSPLIITLHRDASSMKRGLRTKKMRERG
jgi:hypothetical protein